MQKLVRVPLKLKQYAQVTHFRGIKKINWKREKPNVLVRIIFGNSHRI